MFRTKTFRLWTLFLCYILLFLGASLSLAATTTIHYQRALDDYEGWGVHL